jgi:hypothetical protein
MTKHTHESGREAEQADVLAHMQDALNHVTQLRWDTPELATRRALIESLLTNLMGTIRAGQHVGKAGNEITRKIDTLVSDT